MNIESTPINVKFTSTLLAVDTATESCSAALLYKGILSSIQIDAPREHTEKILPMIDALLDNAKITLQQIDAIVFGEGPGSFTGVRVGVSVAQALGFGIDKPLIPISNLQALAEGLYRLNGQTTVLAAIDARMGEVYVAGYDYDKDKNQWLEFLKPEVLAPNALNLKLTKLALSRPIEIAGTGFLTYPDIYQSNDTQHLFSKELNPNLFVLPQAKDMITLAISKFEKKEWIDALNAEPSYIRNEVTWQKLSGK